MVLCAYGENPFTGEALESLKRQSVPVQLVVATSTPSARLEELANRYGAEYRVNPERGGGIGADWARNYLSQLVRSLLTHRR